MVFSLRRSETTSSRVQGYSCGCVAFSQALLPRLVSSSRFPSVNLPLLAHLRLQMLANLSKVRNTPSEGKGHTFESCRVRQPSCKGWNRAFDPPRAQSPIAGASQSHAAGLVLLSYAGRCSPAYSPTL